MEQRQTDLVWLDGELVPWDRAQVHVLTHTLHYGLGAFEGIRSYQIEGQGPSVFRLQDHVERLFRSCLIATIDVPYTQEEIVEACLETLRRNRVTDGYLRPLVFLGDPRMGLGSLENPTRVAIAAFYWGTYLGEDGLTRGIRARVSSFTRGDPNATMSKAKLCGQYVNSVLARREATAVGCDEAIMLDRQGYVAEGSGENLFLVQDGQLVTPPLGSAVLGGLTRDSVIQLARDDGLVVLETTVTRDQLYIADEVFFTGTAAEVTPIREIDGRQIGSGTVGPVTRRLQERYFDAVRGPQGPHPEWRTAYEWGGSGGRG